MARYVWIGINVAVSKPNKPTPKATLKPTTPKKLSLKDQMLVEGFKKLSPSQQKQIAKLFGWQKAPSQKPQPRGTYNPKDWEGVVGDKGW